MPSLQETLQSLAAHSAQIKHLATLNTPPAGPFTRAQLRLPYTDPLTGRVYRDNLIPDLIRDAEESERRLFTFVGEEEGPKGVKVVEKREGGVVMPLRAKEEDVEVLLGTALKLVDTYRPMPRARAHVQSLLDSYREQQEHIAALQRQIAETSDMFTVAEKNLVDAPGSVSSKTTLSPDDIIQNEEAALKELEAEVAELRRQKRANAQASAPEREATDAFPSTSSSLLSQKTPPPVHASLLEKSPPASMSPSPPPAPMKTPVRNVALQRARAANTPLAHFSPTRPAPSARRALGQVAAPRMSIFGVRKRMPVRASTPPLNEEAVDVTEVAEAPALEDDSIAAPSAELVEGTEQDVQVAEADAPEEGDVTIRLDAPAVVQPQAQLPEGNVEPALSQKDEAPEPEVSKEEETIDSPLAEAAVAKIWAQLSDLMKQGDNAPTKPSADVGATIRNLTRITNAELPAPPSPSSSSAVSSLSTFAPAKSAPLTPLSILTAHLCLLLLRAGPDMIIPLNEVKTALGAIATSRGFGDGPELGTKTIYGAVGKKVIRIDRRGGGPGGRLVFNL